MLRDQVLFALAVVVAIVAVVTTILRRRTRIPEMPVDSTALLALQKEWHAPSELLGSSTPREVRYARGALVMFSVLVACMVGFATAGVLLIPGMQRDLREIELVRREGVAIDGTVTARRMTGSKSTSYRVTYAYDIDGHRHTSEARVKRNTYERLTVGAKATLRYAPSQPDLSLLDENDDAPPQARLLVFLPILVLLIPAFSVMRLKKLLAWGTPVGAIVTRVDPYKSGQSIRYQFLDSNGEVVTGRDNVRSRGEVAAGDIITVVFDPDRPRRRARYPMDMVKVAE